MPELNIGHNSKHEFLEMCRIQSEKNKAIESLQAKIREIKKGLRNQRNTRIKSGLGMNLEHFDYLFKNFYDAEDDARTVTLEALQFGFSALEVGANLDWVEVLTGDSASPGEEATDDLDDFEDASDEDPAEETDGRTFTVSSEDEDKAEEHEHDDAGAELITDDDDLEKAGHAYNEGFEAGSKGMPTAHNPHKKRSNLFKQWDKGHAAGVASVFEVKDEPASNIEEFPGGEPMDVPEIPEAAE